VPSSGRKWKEDEMKLMLKGTKIKTKTDRKTKTKKKYRKAA
jgi:hypothetical protein